MEFDRNTRVNATHAKQDRISVHIGEWIFDGDDSRFELYIGSLQDQEWPRDINPPSSVLPLCRHQKLGNRYSLKFSSRKVGGSLRANAPLIDGKIVFHKTGFNEFGPSRYIGKAEITINPTRALVHQPVNSSVISSARGITQSEPLYPAANLLSDEPRELIRSERPINPLIDNVIIDRNWEIMSRPEYWNRFLDNYLSEVIRVLNDLIFGALNSVDNSESRLNFRWNINIKEVETYWEFTTPDPIRKIYELEPQFRALGTNFQRREYDNVSDEILIDGNALTLSTQLKTGLRAKLYPKTTGRLRLETVHKLTEFTGLDSAHVFTSPVDFANCIIRIAGNAATELNELLEVLCAALPPYPPQCSVYDLVREIIRCTPEVSDQNLLMSAIVNNGAYRSPPGDPLRVAIRTLVTNDVLRRTRRYSYGFCLTDKYFAAREILMSQTNDPDQDT